VGHIWQDFLEHMQEGTLMSTITNFGSCGILACSPRAFIDQGYTKAQLPLGKNFSLSHLASVNNDTWTAQTRNRYCPTEEAYDKTTLAEWSHQTCPSLASSEIGKGVLFLWHTSEHMLQHQPRPFHIFVSWLELEAHGVGSWLHHPMYGQQFVEYAEKLGINYTAFIGSYPGMRPNLLAELPHVVESEHIVKAGWSDLYYVSSTPWRERFPTVKAIDPYDQTPAHMPFACLVTGMGCHGMFANPTSCHGMSCQVSANPGAGVMAFVLGAASCISLGILGIAAFCYWYNCTEAFEETRSIRMVDQESTDEEE